MIRSGPAAVRVGLDARPAGDVGGDHVVERVDVGVRRPRRRRSRRGAAASPTRPACPRAARAARASSSPRCGPRSRRRRGRSASARGRRGGEDHVGPARRRVAVDVDADHEVERLERGGQAVGVRRRDERVAAERDHRADLALAGRLDLLGHARGRQLAEDLGRAAHAARPAAEASCRARCPPRASRSPAAATSRRPAGRGCR